MPQNHANLYQYIVFKVENIIKEPNNKDFLSINQSNSAFNKRVGKVIGGKAILKEIGFSDLRGYYTLKKVNIQVLKEWQEALELIKENLMK